MLMQARACWRYQISDKSLPKYNQESPARSQTVHEPAHGAMGIGAGRDQVEGERDRGQRGTKGGRDRGRRWFGSREKRSKRWLEPGEE